MPVPGLLLRQKNNNKQSCLLACARDHELRYHNSGGGTGSRFVALIVTPRYKNVNPTNFSPPQDFATTPRGWPLEATSSTGIRAPPALSAKTGGAVQGVLSSVRKLDFRHNPPLLRPKRHSDDNSIRNCATNDRPPWPLATMYAPR